MLLFLLEWLEPLFPKLSRLALFRYITVRSACALLFAFVFALVVGPPLIRWLRNRKASGPIRKAKKKGALDVYATHAHKSETPIMGGLLIIGAVLVAAGLLCDLTNPYVLIALAMTIGFATIGFADDFLKVTQRNTKGLPGRYKLTGQFILGAVLALLLMRLTPPAYYEHLGVRGSTGLTVPFFKGLYPDLGLLYVPFVMLVVCATSNAVNLTDGLDGLAIGITIITSLALTIVVYLVTRFDYAGYLYFPYIAGGGELVIILLALVGAGMGFLWFNSHPATVFMGDTGSLAIGGLLGTVAVMARQELLLVILGGIFVIEAVSVVIQVTSYKLRGKRVFLMSPYHLHFEKKGWVEAKIIARFWIMAAMLALMGLSTLKIR